MTTSPSSDPFKILGVPQNASEAELRARYLELVKQFPPDREPDTFREIQTAFEAAKDPLVPAQKMLMPPAEGAPQWSDAIEQQKEIAPPLSRKALLGLGDRDDEAPRQADEFGADEFGADEASQGQHDDDDPNRKRHFVEQPHE